MRQYDLIALAALLVVIGILDVVSTSYTLRRYPTQAAEGNGIARRLFDWLGNTTRGHVIALLLIRAPSTAGILCAAAPVTLARLHVPTWLLLQAASVPDVVWYCTVMFWALVVANNLRILHNIVVAHAS